MIKKQKTVDYIKPDDIAQQWIVDTALIKQDYRFGVVSQEPADPRILGDIIKRLISDQNNLAENSGIKSPIKWLPEKTESQIKSPIKWLPEKTESQIKSPIKWLPEKTEAERITDNRMPNVKVEASERWSEDIDLSRNVKNFRVFKW